MERVKHRYKASLFFLFQLVITQGEVLFPHEKNYGYENEDEVLSNPRPGGQYLNRKTMKYEDYHNLYCMTCFNTFVVEDYSIASQQR